MTITLPTFDEVRRAELIAPVVINTAEQARQLRLAIQRHAPVDTGALKASWDDPRTVQILPNGTVQIDNPLAYARIQDVGGTIPPYDIIEAKGPGHVMRAEINGKIVFFTKRGAINIKPQHYVRKGLEEFLNSPAARGQKFSVKWGDGGVTRQPSMKSLYERAIALYRSLSKIEEKK